MNAPPIKLIVGLGNPGSSYSLNRHNVGQWFIHRLIDKYQLSLKNEKKLHGQLASLTIDNEVCRLLIPNTFMNLSGLPIRETCDYFNIKPDEIVIVHDELDLLVGRIKLKTGGGHGGHNGLRDTFAHLKNENFHRIRIGIGHPGHRDLVTSYVLSNPSVDDKALLFDAINRGCDIIPLLLKGNINMAMNGLNS